MTGYVLNKVMIFRLIYSLLPHKPPYRLLIDRTNWENGSNKINILVIAIIERYIRLFSKASIKDLLADREFIGDKWLNYLNSRDTKYHIRVLAHHGVMRYANDWKRKARCIFSSLRINQFKSLNKCTNKTYYSA